MIHSNNNLYNKNLVEGQPNNSMLIRLTHLQFIVLRTIVIFNEASSTECHSVTYSAFLFRLFDAAISNFFLAACASPLNIA